LTATQAAKKLRRAPSNIYDAIERGRLQAEQIGSVLLVSRASPDPANAPADPKRKNKKSLNIL
jgi:hypothetical protein